MNTSGDHPRSWPKVIAVAAVALGVAAGVLALTGHHSTTPGTALSPDVRTAPPAGTSAPGSGARPVPETPAGAATVAATIVSDEPLLVQGTAVSAAALVDSWATPAARAAIERAFTSARAGFVAARGGPYGFDTALLAERVTATGPGQVRVDAWCAEVLLERGAPTSGLYVTEQLDLAWTAGRWRLTSISDRSGPSVALAGTATPAPEAAASLAGFAPPAAASEAAQGTQGGR